MATYAIVPVPWPTTQVCPAGCAWTVTAYVAPAANRSENMNEVPGKAPRTLHARLSSPGWLPLPGPPQIRTMKKAKSGYSV
jgi:hypothetical protein